MRGVALRPFAPPLVGGMEVVMKEVKYSLDDAKNRLFGLKGINVLLKVNLGRNKIVEYNGTVENLYASVFTVKSDEDAIKTYSYSDVLTGNVRFYNRALRSEN
jgi:uncharacterized protein Veg